MPAQYSIVQARDHWAKIVHAVEKGKPVELTRRGKTVAVLVSARDFQHVSDTGNDFWERLVAFRKELVREGVAIDPGMFKNLRDNAPPRKGVKG